ncbi:hypothetical protein VIGAN_01535000 [Vigna angularis var. angularis]|uniref:Uncharacterized protein n=2 Tax=Phaseolus angularis TaxID=3914 RepID=A0A0S3R9C0_PHAAN|nr:hypothetical protein VIGAN_01535000 [Vigna angularis var. angularis]
MAHQPTCPSLLNPLPQTHTSNFLNSNMEVALELEDDLFFADLSKQISLLIMDEEEDEEHPLASSPQEHHFQTYSSGSFYHPPQSAILYEHALRRQSKGTGVFIPQSTQPRRKHRKGRSSSNAKHQKQSPDTAAPVPIKKPVSNPKMVEDTYMSSHKTT